eukprot:scaffold46335_cov17-Tisochrysis_lutea.AAC.1
MMLLRAPGLAALGASSTKIFFEQFHSQRGFCHPASTPSGCRMPHFWLLHQHSHAGRADTTSSSNPTSNGPHAHSASIPFTHSPDHSDQLPAAGYDWQVSTPISTLDLVAGPQGCAPRFALLVYGGAGASAGGGGGLDAGEQSSAALRSTTQTVAVGRRPGAQEGWTAGVQEVGTAGVAAGAAASEAMSCPWASAAGALNQKHSQHYAGALVHTVHIAPRKPSMQEEQGPGAGKLGACTMLDVNDCWPTIMRLPLGSVVLVRPDGHIAWRYVASPPENGASVSVVDGAGRGPMRTEMLRPGGPGLDEGTAAELLENAVRQVLHGIPSSQLRS